MAENESLDLKSPHAQRWNPVRDAARKGASCQKVAALTRKAFFGGLRKALVQFEVYGVTTADFLASQGSPRTLSKLLQKTQGHPYAEQLVAVLDSNPAAPAKECLNQWGHAIFDKVFDQIVHSLGGSEIFPSFFDGNNYFRQVRDELRGDLERVAIKLVENPRWRPIVRSKKGEPKSDSTSELMPMSLVGGPKR
jgi:hypothetical protein